jgi:hypothetical protein
MAISLPLQIYLPLSLHGAPVEKPSPPPGVTPRGTFHPPVPDPWEPLAK